MPEPKASGRFPEDPKPAPKTLSQQITQAIFGRPPAPPYFDEDKWAAMTPEQQRTIIEVEKMYPTDRRLSRFAQAGKAVADTLFSSDPKPAPVVESEHKTWNAYMDAQDEKRKQSLFQRVADFPVGEPEQKPMSIQEEKANTLRFVQQQSRKNPEAPLPQSIEERWNAIKDE